MAEQHLPGAAQVLLHMDRRWQQDLLGKALSPNASEPLGLWTTPAQTLKPEQTAGHPFHAAQNASQPKEVQVFAVEEWKAINHDWEQEALQIPGAEHVQLNPPVNPGN